MDDQSYGFLFFAYEFLNINLHAGAGANCGIKNSK